MASCSRLRGSAARPQLTFVSARALLLCSALLFLTACGSDDGAQPATGDGGDVGVTDRGSAEAREIVAQDTSELDQRDDPDPPGEEALDAEEETPPVASPWSEITWPENGRWHAIAGLSFDDLLVVGEAGRALLFNGRDFLPLDLGPDLGREEALPVDWFGADARSDEDVETWAIVGAAGTLLRRRGGGPFEALETGVTAALRDVRLLSPATLYAVGEGGTIVRWVDDEGATQEGANTGSALHAIWGTTALDLLITGSSGGVYEKMGDTWFRQQLTGSAAGLRGLHGLSGLRVIVGDQGTLLHDIGLGWETKLSNDLELRDVRAVRLGNQNEGWAAGAAGLLLRWAAPVGTAGKWSRVDLPAGVPDDVGLDAVWVETGDAGAGARRGVIAGDQALLVNDGSGWRSARGQPSGALLATASLGDGAVAIVGEAGLLLLAREGHVTGLSTPTSDDLGAVAQAPDGSLWIGGQGRLWRSIEENGVWEEHRVGDGDERRIRAIAWPYLVGDEGLIARVEDEADGDRTAPPQPRDAGRDAGRVRVIESGVLQGLKGAALDAAGHLWVVGDDGVLLRVREAGEGLLVEGFSTTVTESLNAVATARSGSDGDDLLIAVGDHGVVLRWRGGDDPEVAAWRSAADDFWYAISAPEGPPLEPQTNGTWLIGGFAGRVMDSADGQVWARERLPRPITLRALERRTTGALAVGDGAALFARP